MLCVAQAPCRRVPRACFRARNLFVTELKDVLCFCRIPCMSTITKSVLSRHSPWLPAFLYLMLMTGFCSSGFGWSRLGHTTIASLAFDMLSNNVRTKVTLILNTNDLLYASIWPDLVRDVHDTPEMQQFNTAHPNNRNWHFVNLPLKATEYDPGGSFARPDDIVQMINRCIDVLEGQSTLMSKPHAVRWLVHLVGDLHQPLHVGCGYYNFDADDIAHLQKTPAAAAGKQHDRGGNRLRYTSTRNLHSFWDDDLVDRIDGSPGEAGLPAKVKLKIKPKSWKSSGPIREWTARWALDSVKEAHSAYWGIKFGEADLQADGDINSIVIIRPNKYGQNQTNRATVQLAKGAFHLAELLNNIQWQ